MDNENIALEIHKQLQLLGMKYISAADLVNILDNAHLEMRSQLTIKKKPLERCNMLVHSLQGRGVEKLTSD